MDGSEYDVGGWDDLAPGVLRGVTIGECQIMLARVGDEPAAVGKICPHAGADLTKGVLQETMVTCPWHKAAFDLRTGVCSAPPALDDLPRFAARVQGGRILVRLPGRLTRDAAIGLPDMRCMAIVGAGAAGAVAAQTLRQAGFGGRVVLIGREDELPYDRTILSKYALSGESGLEKTPLQSAYFYNSHAIERRVGDVTSIDAAKHELHFADGSVLDYDAVLLATGGVPRPPDFNAGELAGVFALRTLDDARAIDRAAHSAKRCVVSGGGFIGMEVAAALRERGLEVHVIAPQETPFATQLGAEVGNALAQLHRDRGIEFHLKRNIASLIGEGCVTSVVLDDGTTIAAEMVILGHGIRPELRLFGPEAMRAEGGVVVDASMRVRDGLYAAGDIATFPIYGTGDLVRVEHWRVAQQHGRIAALAMLGQQPRFTAVPVFWTIHFRKRLDYVGHATRWDSVVIDGDLDEPRFFAFYIVGGVVAALAGFDQDFQMAAAIKLFEDRHDWTVEDLRTELRQ